MEKAFKRLALGLSALALASCTTSLEQYREAAQAGDPVAQNALGLLYKNGDGVPLNRKEAMEWFAKAAYRGNAEAMCNMGDMWVDLSEFGDFEPGEKEHKYYAETIAKAAAYYRKAAEKGLPRAQYELARCYDNATYNNAILADTYLIDLGGNKKDVKAYWAEAGKWYKLAADSGNPKYVADYADFLKYGSAYIIPEDVGPEYLKLVQ